MDWIDLAQWSALVNTVMNLRDGMDWIDVAQWRALVNTVMNLWVP
jgi:hypothetical protein